MRRHARLSQHLGYEQSRQLKNGLSPMEGERREEEYWESLTPDCDEDYSSTDFTGRVRVYVLNHEIPTTGSTDPRNSAYPRQNMP